MPAEGTLSHAQAVRSNLKDVHLEEATPDRLHMDAKSDYAWECKDAREVQNQANI